MKYLNKTFTVGGHSKAYADNYDAAFGRAKKKPPRARATSTTTTRRTPKNKPAP